MTKTTQPVNKTLIVLTFLICSFFLVKYIYGVIPRYEWKESITIMTGSIYSELDSDYCGTIEFETSLIEYESSDYKISDCIAYDGDMGSIAYTTNVGVQYIRTNCFIDDKGEFIYALCGESSCLTAEKVDKTIQYRVCYKKERVRVY